MSDDEVQDIFGEMAEDQPEVAETPAADEPAPEVAQPEGETEAKGENEAAPPAAKQEDEPRHVPYEALRDERTKRQALERRLAEQDAWRQQVEAQVRNARLNAIEDPNERMQAAMAEAQRFAVANKLSLSRQYAERIHGADLVNEVVEFFNDPQHAPMSHRFMATEDPFGAAVEYYRAQKLLAEVGADPDAYRQKLEGEIRAKLLAELNPAKPTQPPPSMAAAPASGRNANPVGSGFDALFGAD